MNIDWTQIEDNFMWAAMDSTGQWWAYEDKPYLQIAPEEGAPCPDSNVWVPSDPDVDRDTDHIPLNNPTNDPFLLEVYALTWQDTLQERP